MKSNKNILVVEDNSIICKNITNAISKNNSTLNIQETGSLAKAISLINNFDFDIITLDINLIDGNGLELLKQLQEIKFLNKILVFSTHTHLKNICLKYGAFAFFDKATDFEDFTATLKTLI